MSNENKTNYAGIRWGDLPEEVRSELLANADFFPDGMSKGLAWQPGDTGIVDLTEEFSVRGYIDQSGEDEAVIAVYDDAVIYNCQTSEGLEGGILGK